MNSKAWLALMVAAAASPGCGLSTTNQQDRQIVSVPLQATHVNAGKIAQATLVAEGKATGITFVIGGVPDGVTRPVHLYTFIYPGTCSQLGAEATYAMNRIVLAERIGRYGGWRLSKSLPVGLEPLRSGGYSIVVRTSPADGNLDIFCGEIP